jgi:hypothetical protein
MICRNKIKIDSKGIDRDDADWINMAENRLPWPIIKDTVMIFTVFIKD